MILVSVILRHSARRITWLTTEAYCVGVGLRAAPADEEAADAAAAKLAAASGCDAGSGPGAPTSTGVYCTESEWVRT